MRFKKSSIILVLILGLASLCLFYVQPANAQYQSDIIINADGIINPSGAPIQRTDDSYMLTGDIVGSISVMRSNITFNGNGYSITGLGTGHGPGGLIVGCNYYSSPPILAGASNVVIKNLVVKDSAFGISLLNTSDSTVTNNTILGTGNSYLSIGQPTAAVYVEGGGSNIITENNLVNNYVGIYFLESQRNLIVRNNVVNCSNTFLGGGGPAIVFWGASNNAIYHNNFVDNPEQAFDGSFNSPFSVNTWDNGYPSGGNYWSDYSTKYPNVTEISASGVGNTPYVIDAENLDRYPLMQRFDNETYANKIPPKIFILSPAHQTYNETSIDLVFTINEPHSWVGYSLDNQDNVTITSNRTITEFSRGVHTLVVYANDTFGNVGASETISFTAELPPSFPVIPVVVVLSIAVAACGGYLFCRKRRR